MRFLLIHAKEFKYRTTKEVKISVKDEVSDAKEWHEFENVLVAFTGIEKEDEGDEEKIAERGAEELEEINQRVNADRILIYPYAHLFSERLARPRSALNILKLLKTKLEDKNIEAHRAPFGWYKEFVLHCLGHPLSESSRQVTLN
ncbi:MAG: threonyl-tRNA synthetase editing domain-containing protein [Candidatus Odinarchaeia archaeon]